VGTEVRCFLKIISLSNVHVQTWITFCESHTWPKVCKKSLFVLSLLYSVVPCGPDQRITHNTLLCTSMGPRLPTRNILPQGVILLSILLGIVTMNNEGSSTSHCFSSDLRYLLRDPVKVWACGHTHYNFDTMIGDTRLVSNQRGYPGMKKDR
jgi:hypothetical protein